MAINSHDNKVLRKVFERMDASSETFGSRWNGRPQQLGERHRDTEILTSGNTTVLKSVLHRPGMDTSRLTSFVAGIFLRVPIARSPPDLSLIVILTSFEASRSFPMLRTVP